MDNNQRIPAYLRQRGIQDDPEVDQSEYLTPRQRRRVRHHFHRALGEVGRKRRLRRRR